MKRVFDFYNNLKIKEKIYIFLFGGIFYSVFIVSVSLYGTKQLHNNFNSMSENDIGLILITDDIKSQLSKLQNYFIDQISTNTINQTVEKNNMENEIKVINDALNALQTFAAQRGNSDLLKISRNLNIRYKAFLVNGLNAVNRDSFDHEEAAEDAIYDISALGSIADRMNSELNSLITYSREGLSEGTEKFSLYIQNLLIVLAVTLILSVLIFFVVGLFFTKNLTKRIKALSVGVKEFKEGCDDCKVEDDYKDEIGDLSRDFNSMAASIKELIAEQNRANLYLDEKVKEKTEELHMHMEKLEKVNKMIFESMNYAGKIQNSLLPKKKLLTDLMGDHFVVWNQRDIVGGDFYAVEEVENGYIVALIDCTGHSVPGALMSMMAISIFDRIVKDKEIIAPDAILKEIDRHLKSLFGGQEGFDEDGLEAGICYVDKKSDVLSYAGAGISLFYLDDAEAIEVKSNRVGLGYSRTPDDYQFSLHKIANIHKYSFYMTTDGIIEQVGGEKRRMFGKKRFKNLITSFQKSPKQRQKELLLEAFKQYKKDEPQRDDMSCIGFKTH